MLLGLPLPYFSMEASNLFGLRQEKFCAGNVRQRTVKVTIIIERV
jgi:hypothetical protein